MAATSEIDVTDNGRKNDLFNAFPDHGDVVFVGGLGDVSVHLPLLPRLRSALLRFLLCRLLLLLQIKLTKEKGLQLLVAVLSLRRLLQKLLIVWVEALEPVAELCVS